MNKRKKKKGEPSVAEITRLSRLRGIEQRLMDLTFDVRGMVRNEEAQQAVIAELVREASDIDNWTALPPQKKRGPGRPRKVQHAVQEKVVRKKRKPLSAQARRNISAGLRRRHAELRKAQP